MTATKVRPTRTTSGWLTSEGLKTERETFEKGQDVVYLSLLKYARVPSYGVFGFLNGRSFSVNFPTSNLNGARKEFVDRIRAIPGTTAADWTRDMPPAGVAK